MHTRVYTYMHTHMHICKYVYMQELIESVGLDELLIHVSSVYSRILIFGVD